MANNRAAGKRMVERELVRAMTDEDGGGIAYPEWRAEHWLKDLDARRIEPAYWTPELVLARLMDAMEILSRTVSKPGPKAIRSVMPEFEREALSIHSMIEQMHDDSLHKLTNKIGTNSLSGQITLMEEAIEWPGKYLLHWPGPLRVLNTALYAKAHRMTWAKVLRMHGIPRPTAKDARARALRIIAEGLNRDAVVVR